MSLGSPLAEGRLLASHLALLQREKSALASQNAELMRTTRALSERCALLEAACSSRDCLDAAEDAEARLHECCSVSELEAQLADAAARASDAEARAAASEERAAALGTRLADAESRHEEVVTALMEARTALAQSRFEADEAALAHRRRVAELTLQMQRLQSLQLSDCSRVATLEIQLAECERAKAALARECAARRQDEAKRKPLADANGAAAGGMRAFAERWQQEW